MSNRDKLPRSMQEAFGPYTSDEIEDPDTGFHPLLVLIYAVALVGFIALVVFGWLPGA
jgi:hypothetical protein